ncbi:hypothetical protein RCL_jg17033.t1 [Rhizophagus clarus]|uniref:Uncharacterized protein n=1 Tax=Rhizophagus clarus TaxID=94130 RepID=A0A8H3QR53_9GLOM|nr:hypothetical protein RCL_jg17033.t1 [Rhizophagus clarus]
MNKENLKEISSPTFNNDKKMCTHCSCTKKKADFCHSHGNNPQYEHSTCNKCYERFKRSALFIEKDRKTKQIINFYKAYPLPTLEA